MLEDKLILIAEDDMDLSNLYRQQLESQGAMVKNARTGKEAIAIAETENPVLILLDIMMPELNGFDVLKYLKENPMTSGIPIVVSTVLTDSEVFKKAKAMGASEYIVKSDTLPSDVIKKIDEILKKSI